MPLIPGTRLGPYEIASAIGAGGMGEVYRARDTRLDRTVAIKVLPPALGSDPEFRARFEREARAISQLQHPNICTLHDVGRHDDTDYLVLEYLEGETLASRLERGSLDPGAALTLAIQVAGALDAAHRAGIVHRDLKPGNVMLVRGGSTSAPPIAKLLDFGLAKPTTPGAGVAPLTAAPTRTTPITMQGSILGTFQYMAPEQLEGREADARSDIWAFGCLLYECLTGRRAFEGASQASLIGAILKDQPSAVSSVMPIAPPALDRVVSTCLAKDPDDRWQSAGDLARELGWIRDAPSAAAAAGDLARPAPTPRLVWLAAMVAFAAATGLVVWWLGGSSSNPGPPILAEVPVAVAALVDDPPIAISPDGTLLAYVTPDRLALMLRDLRTGETRTLVEGNQYGEPFFSPDGLQVGVASGRVTVDNLAVRGAALERIAVGGGAPVTVIDGLTSPKGAWWGDDDWIYYSPAPSAGLWRVRSDGGSPEQLTEPDASNGEKTHRRPFVLPESKAVLFVTGTSRITSFDDGTIEAFSLADRTRHRLVDGGMAPRYIPALGQLVYARAGALIAVPFDPDRLVLTGPPVTLSTEISDQPLTGTSRYTISRNGTLVWVARSTEPRQAAVIAMDRQGRPTRIADAPYVLATARLSPDGLRLATDPDGATQQIAVVDLARGSTQQLTYEWDNSAPVWTPDGAHLVFRSNTGGGARTLYWQAADGSGAAERLTTSADDQIPNDISGNTLVYESYSQATASDLWILSLDNRQTHVFLNTRFEETSARLSPDGRWIAYQSNQSGAWEVYVRAFPSSDRQWQVSAGGGTRPEWLPGGREIVYVRDRDVMSVQVTTEPSFVAGQPARLFALEAQDQLLDVGSDGRLMVLRRDAPPAPTSLRIIVNWFESVRRLTDGRSRD